MKVLLVVDMQKDFIEGSLGTKEAQAIVPRVLQEIKKFDGLILATRDTHEADYLDTQEGKNLPVPHCIRGTEGWEIHPEIAPLVDKVIDKPTFGSKKLATYLEEENRKDPIESITLIGLCTDICVISNALLLKAVFPEVPIRVIAAACAGVNPESHQRALDSMRTCQISVL